MITRWLKWVAAALTGSVILGVVLFGAELPSYLTSSTRQVRSAVKDSVPIDFELQRARDLLETMLPEIHTKIRLIAHEEVEVAALQQEIGAKKSSFWRSRSRFVSCATPWQRRKCRMPLRVGRFRALMRWRS